MLSILFLNSPVRRWLVTPARDFDETPLPAAPDYTDHGPRSWAAFPGRANALEELRPEGEEEAIPIADRPVDCFYLNPTTYGISSGRYYNAPLEDSTANFGIDLCLATQASCFNRLCRIYAPRYRQVTLTGVYYAEGSLENRMKAERVAYGDVKTAFEYFLAKLCVDGRPFIVASHSQGTRLMTRLLAECVEGRPHADRFIAGYLSGGGIPREIFGRDFKDLHPCRGPLDTKCIIGWDTVPATFPQRKRIYYSEAFKRFYMRSEGDYVAIEGKPCLVTNPLTWRSVQDGDLGEEEENSKEGEGEGGQAHHHHHHLGVLFVKWGWWGRVKNLVRCELRDTFTVETRPEWDYVVVSDLAVPDHFPQRVKPPGFFKMKIFGGTYHAQDVRLFYFNIRENAEERIRAFLAARK